MCLFAPSVVLWCSLRFPHNNDVHFVFTSSCLLEGSCHIYVVCVCLCVVVSNTYCVVCLVCLSSSCVHYVASVSGLSSSCVLCTLCCQCLWVVFVLCLVYTMLPVSLGCLRLVSCAHYVASVWMSTFHCPFVLCTLCCQCLWIVHFVLPLSYFWTFIYPSTNDNSSSL
jgi:hypothetical protein